MPIIGKHHAHPYSNAWALKDSCGEPQGEDDATVSLINTYRTPVSGVFRRKDSGFAVCGEKPASVSQFAAGIRYGSSGVGERKWTEAGITGTLTRKAEPVPTWQSVQWQTVCLLRARFAFDPDIAAVARAVDFHEFIPFPRSGSAIAFIGVGSQARSSRSFELTSDPIHRMPPRAGHCEV